MDRLRQALLLASKPRVIHWPAGEAGDLSQVTAAINQAKDSGDLDTLRQIASDPRDFILRQGWASLDFREEGHAARLGKLERQFGSDLHFTFYTYHLAPETTICVLVHQLKEALEGFYFWPGRIPVPFQVRPFPKHLPYVPALNVTGLRDRFLDLLRGIGKDRPHQKQLDFVPLNSLSLPDLISQVKRRPTLCPDQFLNQVGVTGGLDIIEGHYPHFEMLG